MKFHMPNIILFYDQTKPWGYYFHKLPKSFENIIVDYKNNYIHNLIKIKNGEQRGCCYRCVLAIDVGIYHKIALIEKFQIL